MNDKKFTLGLLLVIGIGLTALPMAAAQDFGGGDSGNNEDEGDGNFGGGDGSNNEDEGADTGDGDFGGGDGGNNEDEGDFGGGDSGNNEDEDDSEEDPGDGDEEEPGETETASSTSGDLHVISAQSPTNLQAELSSEMVSPDESVTVSGQLTIDDNADRDITILLNGTEEASVTTDGNGSFEGTFTPSETGSYTVGLEVVDEELSRELELEVASVSIDSLTTSGETTPGQSIEVCAEMASDNEVEVTLYHNNQEFQTATGQSEICFQPVLESGTNTFRAEASAGGETDELQISRNAGSGPSEPTDPGTDAPTGGFLGSPTARIATVGAIIVAVAIAVVAYARRKGALTTPQNP